MERNTNFGVNLPESFSNRRFCLGSSCASYLAAASKAVKKVYLPESVSNLPESFSRKKAVLPGCHICRVKPYQIGVLVKTELNFLCRVAGIAEYIFLRVG